MDAMRAYSHSLGKVGRGSYLQNCGQTIPSGALLSLRRVPVVLSNEESRHSTIKLFGTRISHLGTRPHAQRREGLLSVAVNARPLAMPLFKSCLPQVSLWPNSVLVDKALLEATCC